LVLNIPFIRLCYLFRAVVLAVVLAAVLAALIPIIVPTRILSTATASIAAVPYATEEVELCSTITADFPLARKTSRRGSVRNYIM
jgi:hypothetical protein